MKDQNQEDSFVVIESERSLTIQHRVFGVDAKSNSWNVRPVDANYLLLTKSKVAFGQADGYAFFPVSVFKDVLLGLTDSKWSGVVKIDSAGFMKKIFFRDGRLCFASSSLIDDRLGERLYRSGRISIDELVNSASQVGRNRKFGQVLIESSVMNAVELWDALKDQVLEIFRSVFIPDFTRFALEEGPHKAFMEVVYPQPTEKLIDECFSFACMLREFGRNLPGDATLSVTDGGTKAYRAGTFVGDMVELIQNTGNVSELLNQSKLRPHNTISVLLELVNQGVCKVGNNPLEPGSLKDISSHLNSKADLYSLLLKQVSEQFRSHNIQLPITELRQFALGSNAEGDTAFALDEEGQIDLNCRRNIISQCRENKRRVPYFTGLIESLIHFLLQLTIDLAPRDVVDDVRRKYREMS